MLVVDDHVLVRAALVAALRAEGIGAVACTETTVPGITRFAAGLPPGLVLLDLDLGPDADGAPIDGTDAVAVLRQAGWAVLTCAGSAGHRLTRVAAAVAAGAIGHVAKTDSLDSLVATVVRAASGAAVMTERERRSWLELDRTERTAAKRRAALLARLTPRERRVLERLADGHRATDIAAESVVSVTTVRSQIRAILAKLEVNSQLEAAALLHGGYRG